MLKGSIGEICTDEPLIVVGTLKGYDQLMNLVLDEVRETLRGMSPSPFDAQFFSDTFPSMTDLSLRRT